MDSIHIEKAAIIGCGNMGQYTAEAMLSGICKGRTGSVAFFDSNAARESEIRARFNGKNIAFAASASEAVHGAGLIVFAVPTDIVYDVMKKTLPHCHAGAYITDQTSRKAPAARAYDEFAASSPEKRLHFSPIHTLCNPKSSDARKEILAFVRHNDNQALEWMSAFFEGASESPEFFDSVREHDRCVANTQVNTARTFLSLASSFAFSKRNPTVDASYASSFDYAKFSLAMRVASQPDHVYRGILLGNEDGKRIVEETRKVESWLMSLIYNGRLDDYRALVMGARARIYGNAKPSALMSQTDISSIAPGRENKPNSHYSVLQWGVSLAYKVGNPFADLKATTPMHRALLCMMDYIFNSPELLEQSIRAPFDRGIADLVQDDSVFHTQLMSWSDCIMTDYSRGYDYLHSQMRRELISGLLAEQVEKSRPVISVCRARLDEARASGRIEEICNSGARSHG